MMNERIRSLCEKTLRGEMYAEPTKTAYPPDASFPNTQERDIAKLCAYIRNQEPVITEDSCFTGFFNFDGSVIGDAFHRSGHPATGAALSRWYCKPQRDLTCMEWQHATADYRKVLKKGISGIIGEIDASAKLHTAPEEQSFLNGLRRCAEAMIDWAHKCADRVEEFLSHTEREDRRRNLKRLSETLRRVPEYPPQSFYEAVLCIYVCFSADPDSLGTLDRFLSDFYEHGIRSGELTREEAKDYLQELFLMIQAETRANDKRFTRGGESHFCVGGYLPNGSDGFCDLTRLIIEAMEELPTYIPQITLRWTKKLRHEDFLWVMDMERHDPHKRIAFTNDEKRLQCYVDVCGIPYEKAVGYTMVGCNEPAFCGAITGSNSKGNFAHAIARLFRDDAELVRACRTFDEFYTVFEHALYRDLDVIYAYDDLYNRERAKDINYISSLFFNDCIENAKSLTQGGGNTVIASPTMMGVTNVIDSLVTVRQFVYDEKVFSMDELIAALAANWEGYEDMRTMIVRRGIFFGNDDARSDGISQRLYESLYRYLKNKTNLFGYHFLIGDLVGYNEHHRLFGELTPATPDGRHDGEMLKFCIGQSEGRDRNGLTALLNSVAHLDPNAIACGSTVTNLSLDKQLVENDESFEKLVSVLETYFSAGGVHFQLTYVDPKDLIAAKKTPENYKNLRVRVTGFSDYFVRLSDGLQDDIIKRTLIKE